MAEKVQIGPVTFEDVHPAYTDTGYDCTNEYPEVFRKQLGHRARFDRIASIASGGEVGLFTFLPMTNKELICVDHSYRSLHTFLVKVLMLAELGPKETKLLLSVGGQDGEARKVVQKFYKSELAPKLPDAMIADAEWRIGVSYMPFYYTEIPGEWSRVSLRRLERIAGSLDKLTLIHGDFTDLKDRAPFDMLYLSNMLQHSPRPGIRKPNTYFPDTKPIFDLATEDAPILLTGELYGNEGYNLHHVQYWKTGTKEVGRNGGNGNWSYSLVGKGAYGPEDDPERRKAWDEKPADTAYEQQRAANVRQQQKTLYVRQLAAQQNAYQPGLISYFST